MNKIVTITGHKNSKKDVVASKLAKNEGAVWVKPCTDRSIEDRYHSAMADDFVYFSKEMLNTEIKNKTVLSKITINGYRYVYFKEQMTAPVNILIADDNSLIQLMDNYDNIFSIKIDSEDDSERMNKYLFDHEFDLIFDVDSDIEELWSIINENSDR